MKHTLFLYSFLILILFHFTSQSNSLYQTPNNKASSIYDLISSSLPLNISQSDALDYEITISENPSVKSLPLSIKEKIISTIISSKNIQQNFIEFILGFLNPWLYSSDSLRSFLLSNKFNTGECSLSNLFTTYSEGIQNKNKEHKSYTQIPSNVYATVQDNNYNTCVKNLEDNKRQANEVYSNLNNEIKKIKSHIEQYKYTNQLELLQQEMSKLTVYEGLLNDATRERNVLSNMSCDQIVKEDEKDFHLNLASVAIYITNFMDAFINCLGSSNAKQYIKLYSDILMDVQMFKNNAKIQSLMNVFLFGFSGQIKAAFRFVMLGYSVFNMYKFYKKKNWAEFTFSLGKSIGLIVRIFAVVNGGTR
jgi:uncharacterized protein YqeY